MKTLGARLTLSVVGVAALALLVFSALLYSVIRANLLGHFDGRLRDEARAVANMVEERGPDQRWELELSAFSQLVRTETAPLYEVWMDDGVVLARSESLGSAHLPREGGPAFVLPDGLEVRRLLAKLPARQDEDAPATPTGRLLTIAVARDTRELDHQLQQLIWLLLGGGAVTLTAAAAASRVAIRQSLRPVEQLSAQIDAVDARSLSDRLPLEGLPLELHPIVTKLNALLGRLDESFARERRFSADVSHELRTPIAGLRCILEVTASRERAPSEYQAALADALVVARQMTGLVETLLMLAQLEAQPTAERSASTLLYPLVEAALLPLMPIAKGRRMSVSNQVGPESSVNADPGRLLLVLSNLLSNAVEHTAVGGQIAIVSDPARGIWFEVQNSGPPIPEAALPRIFERFFRADPSRTGTGEHHGLGLSVVRGVCGQLGARVSASNRADGWVTFTVSG